jgi:hypothetical protein
MLDKYETEYPGNYRLIGADGFFHIVPKSSRDVNGEVVERSSILDQKLTLQMSQVSGRDIVCEVLRRISREDREVSCLTDFVRLDSVSFENYFLEDASARDHLVKVITESGIRMSWFAFRSTSGHYGISFYIQQ